MKTLIIHPIDRSTDFLTTIYKDMECTVVRDNCSTSKLKTMLNEHDRIIMLGHGTDQGLMGHGRVIIDSKLVYLLRKKKECIYVWCDSHKFARKYGLDGLALGQFVSEYEEALNSCLLVNNSEIDQSNELFSDIMKEAVHMPNEKQYMYLAQKYIGHNPVVRHNSSLLYYIKNGRNIGDCPIY